jgi:hypothetical protein
MVIFLMLLLLLVGCTENPARELAEQHHFAAQTVSGGRFMHQLYLNHREGHTLHIYIEGDGQSWRTTRQVSWNPGPGKPLMLGLMAQDTAPSIYLGRPCYHQLHDPACGPIWWTDRRYAEEVVNSMSRVLDAVAGDYRNVVLFGHSGGGTLAMLLAARCEYVSAVVTLAGNLDVEAWAAYHGYTPLQGSLNPRAEPPLQSEITQLHLLGENDAVITQSMLAGALVQQPAAEIRTIPRADHSCCWSQLWPSILSEINAGLSPEE